MSRVRLLLAAVAVLALAVQPLSAMEPEPQPEFRTERVYFKCNGDTKVANVNAVAEGNIVGWNTTAPATSFTAGGGCGTADTFLMGSADHNVLYDAPFAGAFKGNLDSLTVHAHSIQAGFPRVSQEFEILAHLQIDGKDVLARTTEVTAAAIQSSTGASALLEFTIDDIGFVDSLTGPGTKNHQVQLTLYTRFIDDENNWVFDATEVDSGITFNPEAPADVVLFSQAP